MEKTQEFALENINCSPTEDRQFRFKLVRATKPKSPVKRAVMLYNRFRILLPDQTSSWHVYVIGRTPPNILNLKVGKPTCYCNKTGWVNVEQDMNERSYIFQIYDDMGRNFPRSMIYYKTNDNGSLVIAIKVDQVGKNLIDVENMKYLRVYSNRYYNVDPDYKQIQLIGGIINSRSEVVKLQREIEGLKNQNTGKMFYYVNGYFVDNILPDMDKGVYIEAMLDKSIIKFEKYKIGSLRTFQSEVDKRIKYTIHRNRLIDSIQYEDDLEIFIVGKNGDLNEGLYYYQNRHEALSNITDKDFALDTNFVNNQSRELSERHKSALQNNYIYIFNRNTTYERSLVFSSLKLHELYKLPRKIEYDVMTGQGYTNKDYRVENLESSAYWKVAAIDNIEAISKELAMEALGYSSVAFYFGYTPMKWSGKLNMPVPLLYHDFSIAYEYDTEGKMIGRYNQYAPMYEIHNKDISLIEFIQGRPQSIHRLYKSKDKAVVDEKREYRIIAAYHEERERITPWEDITFSKGVVISNGRVTVKDKDLRQYRVEYDDRPFLYDIDLNLTRLFQKITVMIDYNKDGLTVTEPVDICYDSIEVFMNGYRLTEGVDFNMDWPHVQICNKTYIDYGNIARQRIHIRATGFNLDKDKINHREISGYVNHGVLSRNKRYDIRDDRVFSVFVGGKLYDRDQVRYAETDNTIRIDNKYNGTPYTIMDRKLSLINMSGLRTEPYYEESRALDSRISDLFDIVHPEPRINEFNVIPDHHYLFSPFISRLIRDMLSGVLSPDIYTKTYNDAVIRHLADNVYGDIYALDPITKNLPDNIIEIHPDYGNTTIEVNVFQYRFIYNTIRVLTGGDTKVNLSGYLTINEDTDRVDGDNVFNQDGPNCPDGTCPLGK